MKHHPCCNNQFIKHKKWRFFSCQRPKSGRCILVLTTDQIKFVLLTGFSDPFDDDSGELLTKRNKCRLWAPDGWIAWMYVKVDMSFVSNVPISYPCPDERTCRDPHSNFSGYSVDPKEITEKPPSSFVRLQLSKETKDYVKNLGSKNETNAE